MKKYRRPGDNRPIKKQKVRPGKFELSSVEPERKYHFSVFFNQPTKQEE